MALIQASVRRQSMASRIALLVGASTLLTLLSTATVAAEDDFGYATKEEALTKAQQLGCDGAYEWEGIWLPCEEDNVGSDDHSGHDHNHGHQH